jgi:hypothetical protein
MNSIDEVISDLAANFPAYTITGGEEAEGFWLRADRNGADWNWERKRMTSLMFAHMAATEALTNG